MITVNRWFDGERWVCVIASPGRTKLHLLSMDETGLKAHHLPRAAERDLLPLRLRDRPYPLKRAALRFQDRGRRFGISHAAKDILASALAQARADTPPRGGTAFVERADARVLA